MKQSLLSLYLFLSLLFSFQIPLTFANGEANDQEDTSQIDIHTLLSEYQERTQQTIELFKQIQNQPPRWYENTTLHTVVCSSVGIFTFKQTHDYIVSPVLQLAFSPFTHFSRWATDCDPQDPDRTSECNQAKILTVACLIGPALYISHQYAEPALNWVGNKAAFMTQTLILKAVQKQAKKRIEALNSQESLVLEEQNKVSAQLQARSGDLKTLDPEVRQTLLAQAASVGDVALLLAIYDSSIPAEAKQIAILQALESCAICCERFDEKSFNPIVTRGCDSKHVFHQACLVMWYKNNAAHSCPICRDTTHPEIHEVTEEITQEGHAP